MIPVLHGVWAAAAGVSSAFEHIETQTVGAGGAASVTFSSIPQTYKHLQVRITARTDRAGNLADQVRFQCNADTGLNYFGHGLEGNGTTASSSVVGTSSTIGILNYVSAATATASVFGTVIADFLDYTSTSKNKTIKALGGFDNNGSGSVFFYSAAWGPSTPAAITSIKLFAIGNYIQYSTVSLYGIR